jgi:hypothetical protein
MPWQRSIPRSTHSGIELNLENLIQRGSTGRGESCASQSVEKIEEVDRAMPPEEKADQRGDKDH